MSCGEVLTRMDFLERWIVFLDSTGLSRKEIEKICGCHENTVGFWFRYLSKPNAEHIDAMVMHPDYRDLAFEILFPPRIKKQSDNIVELKRA